LGRWPPCYFGLRAVQLWQQVAQHDEKQEAWVCVAYAI
jgi:hypothetical protein